MKIYLIVISSILIFSSYVFCQSSENNSDNNVSFPQKVYSKGIMEIELGRLAQHNASSYKVKQFGERMIVDHTQTNKELQVIANKNSIILPDKMLNENQKMYDALSKISGSEFDKQYIKKMLIDHNTDISEFESASTTEKNSDIHEWILKTLPILLQHLKLAQETSTKLGQNN